MAVNNTYKIIISKSLQKLMLVNRHDEVLTGGHVGVYRTIKNYSKGIQGMI